MARKKRGSRAGRARRPAAAAPAVASVIPGPTIRVPEGSVLTVIVDVGPMTVPFTVAVNGRTIIKSLVGRAEPVPLAPGPQVLGWAFAHTGAGWRHTIAWAIDDRDPIVLESRSDAKGDQDHSVGFAVINP